MITTEQRQEAIERMKLLGISKAGIADFEKGKINISLPWEPESIPYEAKIKIKKAMDIYLDSFIKKNPDVLVYFIVINDREDMGFMGASFLMVEKYPEDWVINKTVMSNPKSIDIYGQKTNFITTPAYVYNLDDECNNEFGYVDLIKVPGDSDTFIRI